MAGLPHHGRACPGHPAVNLNLEEYCLAFTAQADIETIDIARIAFSYGDQRVPPLFRNQRQNWIFGILPRIGKIDSRGQPLEKSWPNNANRDMGRLQRIPRPGHPPGANGAEAKAALLVQSAAAETDEGCINRQIDARIFRMRIAPVRIRLPDFDQPIENRRAAIIPNVAAQFYSLPTRAVAIAETVRNTIIMSRGDKIGACAKLAFAAKIGRTFPRQTEMQERPGGLPGSLCRHAQFSRGVALRPRSTKSNT